MVTRSILGLDSLSFDGIIGGMSQARFTLSAVLRRQWMVDLLVRQHTVRRGYTVAAQEPGTSHLRASIPSSFRYSNLDPPLRSG